MTTVTLALTSADQSGMYILLEQNHNWIKRFFGVSIHLLSCICLFTSVKPKTSCVHTRIHRPRFGSATDLCWSDRCCPTLWSWRFHKTQRWKSFMWFIHTHLQTPQRSLSLPVSRSHIRNLQNIPIMSVQNFPVPFRIPSSKRLSDVTPQRWNRSVLELRLHETGVQDNWNSFIENKKKMQERCSLNKHWNVVLLLTSVYGAILTCRSRHRSTPPHPRGSWCAPAWSYFLGRPPTGHKTKQASEQSGGRTCSKLQNKSPCQCGVEWSQISWFCVFISFFHVAVQHRQFGFGREILQ